MNRDEFAKAVLKKINSTELKVCLSSRKCIKGARKSA